MELREYQERFVNGIAKKLITVRKVVGQLATGGGKTICFCAISKRYIDKAKKKVVIAVHRKELLKQTRVTAFNNFGLTCQPIVAGMKFIPDADIYVCMVESLHKRVSQLPKDIGLVIVDECHIANFNKLHTHFPSQYIIGFTATPLSNSKKRPVKMFYDDIVCGVDIPELIKTGSLCQNVTWAPKEIVDRMELAVKGEEFDENLMAEAFGKPKYISNTVGAYEKWAKNTKTIVFNVNIFHSQEVTKAFVEKGYSAQHLDGETPKEEREKVLTWFKNTPDAILCNVGIATTGFDEPSIETVIINKATMSMPLWLQMCGRGSRPTDTKIMFTIIDMGGNAIAHGDWCNTRDWVKIFNEPPKPGKSTAAPVKSCPQCDAIVPASAKKCPYCGYEWPAKEIPIEIELADFVIVTKGINVPQLVKDNEHRKQYYVFYKLGQDLATEAKKTISTMTDEYFTFVLEKYYELAREWTKTQHKKLNKWHQEKAQTHLFNEIKRKYPKWETKLSFEVPFAVENKPDLSFIGSPHIYTNPNDLYKPIVSLSPLKKIQ
jgi:superfamily II DNA or RNA helicase